PLAPQSTRLPYTTLFRSSNKQPVRILRQPAVANLRKPEHSLQHEKGVLHFRADTRLRPVLRPLSLINHALVSITTVREVLSVRRRLPDRFALPSVRLVTPYPCLVPVQQVRQHFGVGHIRRRRRHRVDQLALPVGADV